MSRAAWLGRSPRRWLASGLLATSFFASQFATAHGLLVSVRGDATSVSGRVYYSNGDPGAGEWVQLLDLTQPGEPPIAMNAGKDGGFRFPAVDGRRYRISVTGEEGHTVDSEITTGIDARGRFVEREQAASGIAEKHALWPPPAWAVIGGILLLSLIPAAWLRLKSRRVTRPAP